MELVYVESAWTIVLKCGECTELVYVERDEMSRVRHDDLQLWKIDLLFNK